MLIHEETEELSLRLAKAAFCAVEAQVAHVQPDKQALQ